MLRQIGRRIATDKMIMCLLLVIILGILAVIVGKVGWRAIFWQRARVHTDADSRIHSKSAVAYAEGLTLSLFFLFLSRALYLAHTLTFSRSLASRRQI